MTHLKKTDSLRILTLCYEYPPVGGGGGRVAAQVAAGLVERGHQVRVQTAGVGDLPKREMRDGVEIFRTPSFRKKHDTCTVAEMGLYVATSFFPTLHHLRQWQPHVIHAHFAVPTGALAWLASRVIHRPYLLTVHLGDVPGGVPEQTASLFRLVKPFTHPIWNRAAGITAVSTFVQKLAEKAYHRTPQIILNGISLKDHVPIGDKPMGKLPRIAFVGRMSTQKNPLLALEALKKIETLDWEADFVGDGPLLSELRQKAKEWNLEERVQFHGWTDADGVRRILQNADILLMTSLSEGLPMAGIEALSMGLALVTSRIDGVSDILIHNENGLSIPLEKGADGFADALRVLLFDPLKLTSFQQASLRKVSDFDLEKIISIYESALYQIL